MADLPEGSTTCILLDEQVASAIVDGRQHYLPMHYQCRSMEKDEVFSVLVQLDDETYSVVGKAAFVSNRRMSEDKIVQEANSQFGVGLPKTKSELQKVKASFPNGRKTISIWELKQTEKYSKTQTVSKHEVLFGDDVGLQEMGFNKCFVVVNPLS